MRSAFVIFITFFFTSPSICSQELYIKDVTNINLGTNYKKGLFVVQDGTNDGAEIVERQNFKYVSFEDVIKVLNL